MGSFRPGVHLLAALAALLLSGCASGFDKIPQSSVYEEPNQAAAYPTVEHYPVTQSRNTRGLESQDRIEVSELRPYQAEPFVADSAQEFLKRDFGANPSIAQQSDVAKILQQSRASYSGNCACPEDRDSAGNRCGGRSAYSRAGGASPLCYPSDVLKSKQPAQQVHNPPAIGSGYGAISTVTGLPRTTYVSGYYRKNGTYVKPYYRSKRY